MRAAALVALVACAGCGKKPKQKRTGDAAAVEVVTSPALPDAGVHGATSDEIEPNDGDDVATTLALGATVHGVIDPGADADVDHYRIDVAEAGALSVLVEPRDALDVVLEIKDATGAVIARSDRGGVKVREGVPNLGVVAGRYTAVIQARKPPPPKKKAKAKRGAVPEPVKPLGGPYELTASMATAAAGAEHEPDDDRGEANDLIAGDTGTGLIGWTGDSDVWKVSIEALAARNALDIELSAVDGVALSVELANGVGQVITTRKGARGKPLAVRGFVPVVPAGAPPFHYVTVKADKSNPETAYQLRVTAKVTAPDAELEPNDTPETAMAFPADRKSLHAQWSTGDVDCFTVPIDEAARTLDISIDTPNELDLGLAVLIDGKVVVKADHPGKGAAEKVSAAIPAGAQAVIRVHGTDSAGDTTYDLVIDEGNASP